MKRLLTSCFGLGFLPVAPGTWGSLGPVVVLGILLALAVPAAVNMVILALLAIVFSAVCVKFAPDVIAKTGSTDPSEIVADETAGQAVTFLFVGWAATEHICGTIIAGFLLFRLFDIVKPWPIRKLEKLDKGCGILADDLLAGVFAGIVLLIAVQSSILAQICGFFAATDGITAIAPAVLLGITS